MPEADYRTKFYAAIVTALFVLGCLSLSVTDRQELQRELEFTQSEVQICLIAREEDRLANEESGDLRVCEQVCRDYASWFCDECE